MTGPDPARSYDHRVMRAWQSYARALERAITDQAASMQVQSLVHSRRWLAAVADELHRSVETNRAVLDSALDEANADEIGRITGRGR